MMDDHTWERSESKHPIYYKIVFGCDGTLVAACMQSFDEFDYDIAVDKRFENETEARLVALALNNIANPAEMLKAVQELEKGGA